MIVSKLILKNWRNFKSVDVELGYRVFVVGPNASGKSNLLDAFRFLRDIVTPGGGLQKAITDRGGISKIRSLFARQHPDVEIDVCFAEGPEEPQRWRYTVGIRQQPRGHRQAVVTHERVWRGEQQILERPDTEDKEDPYRLTQTHLEQLNTNKEFREIYFFLGSVLYLHLIPQILRFPEIFTGMEAGGDPFGRNFLHRIVTANKKTRRARLGKIEKALRAAVPNIEHLTDTRDEKGNPHLEAIYKHWRPQGAKQREDQFSDGTLRLIALLWSFLEGDSLLLLEEPELSLNASIVAQIPAMLHNLRRKRRRQVFLSTHSHELLSNTAIGLREVLLLTPGAEGTDVMVAAELRDVRELLEAGLTVADALLPRTTPADVSQLSFIDDL